MDRFLDHGTFRLKYRTMGRGLVKGDEEILAKFVFWNADRGAVERRFSGDEAQAVG